MVPRPNPANRSGSCLHLIVLPHISIYKEAFHRRVPDHNRPDPDDLQATTAVDLGFGAPVDIPRRVHFRSLLFPVTVLPPCVSETFNVAQEPGKRNEQNVRLF